MEALKENRAVLIMKYLFDVRVISMTAVTVSISAVYALYARTAVYPLLFALTLLAALLLHMSANAFNHYLDFLYKIDTTANALSQGPPRIIPLGVISEKTAGAAAFSMMLTSALIGSYLATQSGIWVIVIGVLGVTLFAVYDARPIQLKARAFGEVIVFLIWGPLMALGSFAASTKAGINIGATYAALPETIAVVAMLYVNNLEHVSVDKGLGIKTLPMLLGKYANKAYYALLVSSYLAQIAVIERGFAPWSTLITLLSSPLLIQLMRTRARGERAYFKTAKFLTAFGLLYVLGFALGLIARRRGEAFYLFTSLKALGNNNETNVPYRGNTNNTEKATLNPNL